MQIRRALLAILVLVLVAAACGDDDSSSPTTAPSQDGGSSVGGTDAGSDDTPTPSGSAGFLTLGDERIQFDSARCFLEEQEAAGGGGKILATGQGFGTNADGAEVMIDFTRFDEESRFTGDDLSVTVGDPFEDDSVSYSGSLDLGAVEIDGRRLSGNGFMLQSSDISDTNEYPASFELNC